MFPNTHFHQPVPEGVELMGKHVGKLGSHGESQNHAAQIDRRSTPPCQRAHEQDLERDRAFKSKASDQLACVRA